MYTDAVGSHRVYVLSSRLSSCHRNLQALDSASPSLPIDTFVPRQVTPASPSPFSG